MKIKKNTRRGTVAISKFLNNINVQSAALYSYIDLNLALKLIYVSGGIIPKSIFKTIVRREVDEVIEELLALNLIQLDKTYKEETFILLRRKAIQIIENKENKELVEEIKLSKKTDDIRKISKRCEVISPIFKAILSNYDDKNEGNQVLLETLDCMIYSSNNKTLNSIQHLKKNFPNKDTMASKKNTQSKKLLKSGIYRMEHNKFFLYVNSRSRKQDIEILSSKLSFIKENFFMDSDKFLFITNVQDKTILDKTLNLVFSKEDAIFISDVRHYSKSYNEVKALKILSEVIKNFSNVSTKMNNIAENKKLGVGFLIRTDAGKILLRVNPSINTNIEIPGLYNYYLDCTKHTDKEIYDILYSKVIEIINLYKSN